MLKLLLAAAVLLAAAAGAAYWSLVRDDGAEAQTQLIRWVNVTVEVPRDSGLHVSRDFWGLSDDVTAALIISPADKGETGVVIDAETGAILLDKTDEEDRAAIDEVLRTIAVSALDRATAPWPYNADAANATRERWGKITYIVPDPASGIVIWGASGDGGGGSGEAIQATNGLSMLSIDAATGTVFETTTRIRPEDKEAFDRFLATVEHVGP